MAYSFFFFLPAMKLAHAELLAVRFPLWNPYKFLGRAFLADLMTPIFIRLMTLALLIGTTLGLNLVVMAHYGLACAGAYALARRGAGVSRGAALAGLTFALSATLAILLGRPIELFAMFLAARVWPRAWGLVRDERKLEARCGWGWRWGCRCWQASRRSFFTVWSRWG